MSQPVEKIQARVAALEGVYDQWAPEMDPHGDPIFKAAFETAQGVKIFWISSIEYYRLKVGMEGTLQYQGDTLISFAPWIQASFDMNQS